MNAHTPGPWVFEPGPKGDADVPDAAFIVAEAREAGHVVATVLDPCGGDAQANARLIAAAPKMAALILSAYQHVSHGGPSRADVELVLREAGLIE